MTVSRSRGRNVFTTASRPNACATECASRSMTRDGVPHGADTRSPCARFASRATTVTYAAPSSASAYTAGRAVPPAPTTTADAPARSASPASAAPRAHRRCRCCRLASRLRAHQRVGRADEFRASGRSSANRSAANLPGIVTDMPTHSGPKPAPGPAIRRPCTRCGHTSSRRAPGRGRRRGAAAVTGNARSVSPAPPLCADATIDCRQHGGLWARAYRPVEDTVALGQFDVARCSS